MYKELALFILLVLVVFVNPQWATNLYSTILGRLILVVVLTYFAMSNVTLALIVALVMIIGFNNFYTNQMYGIEGFFSGANGVEANEVEGNGPEANKLKEKKQQLPTSTEGTELVNNDGPLDYTHLENNIRPKESATINAQLESNPDSEVEPNSMENFENQYAAF
jgi:hypothetical protein